MNFQLKKKSLRSPWPAWWKKTYSAATVVIFCMIISVLFLSLVPCPTDLPDEGRLHQSGQISSGTEITLNNIQRINFSLELKSSNLLNDSLKSGGSLRKIYHDEDLFNTPDAGNRRVSIGKNVAPGFVCRWLLHYHRDHK